MSTGETALSLYREHRGDLLKYASRIVRDEAAAEDVVQEAWLRFSTRNFGAAGIAQPKSYLFTIVRNLALDWLRRASIRGPAPSADISLEDIVSDAPSAERVLHFRDELRSLHAALAELPEGIRVAFQLHRVERRTLQETADLLGISTVAVHKRVKRATLHCADRDLRTQERLTPACRRWSVKISRHGASHGTGAAIA